MTDRLFGSQNFTVSRGEDGKLVATRAIPPHLAQSQSKAGTQFSQTAAVAEVGGTGSRFHGMKARFRPLFSNVELVEDWYNRIAPPKIKEKFRTVSKLLLSVAQEKIGRDSNRDADPAEWHRANHVLKLYGDIFSASSHDRVVAFLYHSDQIARDMFGDAMNSLLSAFPAKTQTKAAWLPPERLAEQPDRTRFHRVIDWTSLTAAERVREGYVNPMDTKRFGIEAQKSSKEQADTTLSHVPTQLKMGNKRTIGAMQALVENAKATTSARGGGEAGEGGEDVVGEIGHVADTLTKKKKSHLELSGGRYEIDPATGASIFQVKGQAMSTHLGGGAAQPGKSSMKERIVAASGVPSHSWKSTTKDHFPNLSHGLLPGMGRVDPERHPCVARATAATCMIVPSFQPKQNMPVPSRGIKL